MNALTRFGAWVFRYRNALFPVVLVVSLVVGLPEPVASVSSLSTAGLMVGALLAITGEAFRLAVIGYAYIKRGGKDGQAYADALVREGLFAHARHPLYTGNLAVVCGLLLMYGTPFTVFALIPFFLLVYYAMALNEEAYLVGRFGDEYRNYMASVNRFVPDLRGVSGSVRGFEYDWRRALRKDYGQVALALAGVIIFVTWRMHVVWPWVVPAGGESAVALVFAYVVVRTLKRRGALDQ